MGFPSGHSRCVQQPGVPHLSVRTAPGGPPKKMRFPVLVFVLSFFFLWLADRIGAAIHKRRGLGEDARPDFDLVLTAALTLLGLMIGFTFSMAVTRYDQRKNYEEAEANAIGTEYVRADLLPPTAADRTRQLLSAYLDQRIVFYQTRDPRRLQQNNADTAHLQTDLWSAVEVAAAAHPTPVVALAVSGMNDVLNSQGYTQFAWGNRIPFEAWILLELIGVGCNLMFGYSARRPADEKILTLILPLFVSTSFLLISDIDSPRAGLIRVHPQNLIILSQSIHGGAPSNN